jgi:hypothetical protein
MIRTEDRESSRTTSSVGRNGLDDAINLGLRKPILGPSASRSVWIPTPYIAPRVQRTSHHPWKSFSTSHYLSHVPITIRSTRSCKAEAAMARYKSVGGWTKRLVEHESTNKEILYKYRTSFISFMSELRAW